MHHRHISAQEPFTRNTAEVSERLWHTFPAQEACAIIVCEPANGLSEHEAKTRLTRFGPNRLHQERDESLWEEIWETVREPMQLLLLATGVLYAIFGNLEETLTIFVVILFVIGMEVSNEMRAKRAMATLSTLAEPTALVRRAGRVTEIPAEQVVPGDVVVLQTGRRIPADGRLLDSAALAIDESALTGEALPAEKHPDDQLAADTPLADQRNCVFAGTLVVCGEGTALVVATGMQSTLGHITSLTRGIKAPRTPLQIAMSQLSRILVWIALGVSLCVPALAWLLVKLPLQQAVLTGLSLAFATIPEELPVIISLVLAVGASRLSRREAIIKRLPAVEALGTVTVIATDKTGTVTQNQMQVEQIEPVELRAALLEAGVLCSTAGEEEHVSFFDPLEVALLQAARTHNIDVRAVRASVPMMEHFPFDSQRKLMSVIVRRNEQVMSIVKGAPEAVLARCVASMAPGGPVPLVAVERDSLLARVRELAGAGQRIIALAQRSLSENGRSRTEAEEQLIFLGMIGLIDPPRPEASAAMQACQAAGIRPILITGDHPHTARAIAHQVGIASNGEVLTGAQLDELTERDLGAVARRVSIYARTTSEHKLRLVQSLQRKGEHVAVTGDGINDAPALQAANIGIAMGQKGTDIAREAADIVLADDNFATVVRAIAEGRALFANLRKGIRYYLAVKVALISVTLLPVMLGIPVPFSPIQIILTELFMDVAASAAFLVEPPEAGLMHRPPRNPRARFLDRSMLRSLFGAAAGLCVAVLAVYLFLWYSGAGAPVAHTAAFVAWLMGHMLLAFNLRTEREAVLRLGVLRNRVMLWWAAATLLFALAVTLIPAVQTLVNTTTLSLGTWGLILGAAVIGTCWIEGLKWLRFPHCS